MKERDCYSVSAAKLLALTPVCCSSGITLTLGNQERDYILWSKCTHDTSGRNLLVMVFKQKDARFCLSLGYVSEKMESELHFFYECLVGGPFLLHKE